MSSLVKPLLPYPPPRSADVNCMPGLQICRSFNAWFNSPELGVRLLGEEPLCAEVPLDLPHQLAQRLVPGLHLRVVVVHHMADVAHGLAEPEWVELI